MLLVFNDPCGITSDTMWCTIYHNHFPSLHLDTRNWSMKQSAKRFLAKIVKLTKRLQLCLSFGCVFVTVTESIVFYQKCFFFFRSKLSIFDRDLLRNSSFKSEFVLNLLSSKHSISQQNLNRVVKSSISFLFGVPLLAIGFCV